MDRSRDHQESSFALELCHKHFDRLFSKLLWQMEYSDSGVSCLDLWPLQEQSAPSPKLSAVKALINPNVLMTICSHILSAVLKSIFRLDCELSNNTLRIKVSH